MHFRGYFIEYLLNREDVKPVWHAHVHHDFVKRIGDGTLPIEKFRKYLVQDYLFLVCDPATFDRVVPIWHMS